MQQQILNEESEVVKDQAQLFEEFKAGSGVQLQAEHQKAKLAHREAKVVLQRASH